MRFFWKCKFLIPNFLLPFIDGLKVNLAKNVYKFKELCSFNFVLRVKKQQTLNSLIVKCVYEWKMGPIAPKGVLDFLSRLDG